MILTNQYMKHKPTTPPDDINKKVGLGFLHFTLSKVRCICRIWTRIYFKAKTIHFRALFYLKYYICLFVEATSNLSRKHKLWKTGILLIFLPLDRYRGFMYGFIYFMFRSFFFNLKHFMLSKMLLNFHCFVIIYKGLFCWLFSLALWIFCFSSFKHLTKKMLIHFVYEKQWFYSLLSNIA